MAKETRARIAIGLWIVLVAFALTVVAYFAVTVRGLNAATSGLDPAHLERSLPMVTEQLGSTFRSGWLVLGGGALVAMTAVVYVGIVWTRWWIDHGTA